MMILVILLVWYFLITKFEDSHIKAEKSDVYLAVSGL